MRGRRPRLASAAVVDWCHGGVREAEATTEIRANPGSLRKPETIVLFFPPLFSRGDYIFIVLGLQLRDSNLFKT
jgi:hypothetical protein